MEENCSSKSCCSSSGGAKACSGCGKGSCRGEGQEDGMHEFLLQLADQAWAEVLKEKMKEHILATQKDRMAELAKIVAEGNNQRWRFKMEKKQGCKSFKEQLCNFFSQSKK